MAPLVIEKEVVSISIYSREHLPPHIHAYYGDDEALIAIRTDELIAGELPIKKLRLVRDWLSEKGNRTWAENFYELNPRLRSVTKSKNGNR